MNPQQRRQRDMMGAAWEKKRREKLAEEREAFNRQQAEAEAREAAQQAARKQGQPPRPEGGRSDPQAPFGSGAWQPTATPPTSSPAPAARPTGDSAPAAKAKPGAFREFLSVIFLLLAILAGVWLVLMIVDGSWQESFESVFLPAFGLVMALGLRKMVLGEQAKGAAGNGVPKTTSSREAKSGSNLQGEARSVQLRLEPAGNRNVEVLTFRVERYDNAGNRLTPMSVQMRGTSFEGAIQEGDRVQIPGKWQLGKNLTATTVRNLTTGSVVKARARRFSGATVGNIIFIVALLAVAAYVCSSLNGGW